VIGNIFRIGKEQLLIVLITIFVTLWIGLLEGMAVGILSTLLIQVFFIPPGQLLLHNPLQPNTLMFQESDGKFYVGVKAYSNFLNFLQLKKQLDSVPRKQHVILDLSLTNFVDNTVMEHITQYAEDYEESGGIFEIIGLDVHKADSAHPYAPRRVNRMEERPRSSELALTKRQEEMKEYMDAIGWEFRPERQWSRSAPGTQSETSFNRSGRSHSSGLLAFVPVIYSATRSRSCCSSHRFFCSC
jgi:MFS superfamily sulfate permease-like transporter